MYFSKLLIADIIDFAVTKGVDRKDLIQSLGIGIPEKVDPREQVSYDKMVETLNLVRQTIKDDFLGLHLGEQLILKGTSQVDQIMQNSPTIEEAFNNAINYSRLISDALTSSMEKTKNHTKISFEVNPNWAIFENQAVRQIIDMTLVCTLKSIYWLTGKKYAPLEVHLTYPSFKKRNEYYRVFDCAVKFNKSSSAIIFQNPILDLPVLEHDLGLLANLKKVGNEEIENLNPEHPFLLEVKKNVLDKLPLRTSVQMIAPEFNLSSRTFQRKLQQLETSFKEIEKEILIKLAKKFILFEDRSVEEISYLLGFSESSAFIRFFKKEIKTTPKKFKKLNEN